jgi:hypothetical protein
LQRESQSADALQNRRAIAAFIKCRGADEPPRSLSRRSALWNLHKANEPPFYPPPCTLMKKSPPLDIHTLRKQVQDLGTTLYWQGSQWIALGRHTEQLGHAIKTERDALEFVLDRSRDRTRSVAKLTSLFLAHGNGDGDHEIHGK